MFKRLIAAHTPADGLFRKSAIVASGQALGYGLALVASPVLSRIYSPGDFGLLAIFITLTSVVSTLATLRFENAIPLPNDDRTAQSLAVLAKWSVLLTAICLAMAAALFGGSLDHAMFGSHDAPFTWLLAVAVAAFASCEIHNARLIRGGRFAELSTTRMAFAIACLAIQLSVPLLWMAGPLGLALGQIGGYAGELLVGKLMGRRHKPAGPPAAMHELSRAAMEYRKYPLFDVPSSLLRVFAVHGHALLIAWLYGPAAAGCLLLAHRLLSTPLSMLSFSISRVYYNEAASVTREAPIELRNLFATTARRLFLLGALPLAVVCALAPWTFAPIFGPQWKSAGIYCSLLCPMVLLRMIAFVVGPTLDVVHRQGLRLVRELIVVVLFVLGISLAAWLDWSEFAAVAVTTALGSVGYGISIVLTWQALLSHHRQHAVPAALPDQRMAA